jgi:hypothetical protein
MDYCASRYEMDLILVANWRSFMADQPPPLAHQSQTRVFVSILDFKLSALTSK